MINVVAIPLLLNTCKSTPLASDFVWALSGITSWKNWCIKNGVKFALFDSIPEKYLEGLENFPPTVQRWAIPQVLSDRYSDDDVKVALVDADTIVRWDAPSIFEVSSAGISVIAETWNKWKANSCNTFSHLGLSIINKNKYFNAGVVVVGENKQNLQLLADFLNFLKQNEKNLLEIFRHRVGTDQTPLNLFLQSREVSINCLSSSWNSRIDMLVKHKLHKMHLRSDEIEDIIKVVSRDNISHFASCSKNLMPLVWARIKDKYL